ncbi:hypothetical protein D9M71_711520 [compost metagenome]
MREISASAGTAIGTGSLSSTAPTGTVTSLRPLKVTSLAGVAVPVRCAVAPPICSGATPSSLVMRKRSAVAELARRMSWRTVWLANCTGASGVPSWRSGAGEAVQAGTQTWAWVGSAAALVASANESAVIQRSMAALPGGQRSIRRSRCRR